MYLQPHLLRRFWQVLAQERPTCRDREGRGWQPGPHTDHELQPPESFPEQRGEAATLSFTCVHTHPAQQVQGQPRLLGQCHHGLQHVPHHLPEFAQVRVYCISDAIQPSHPPMPSSPSALSLSQHQGLFQ